MIVAILILILVTYLFCVSLDLDRKLLKRADSNTDALKLIDFLIAQSRSRVQQSEVPRYKFYSQIVEELIEHRSRFGSEIKVSLQEIRKSLSIELRENKKIKEAMVGGYFQYLTMAAFIWGFVFAAQNLIEMNLAIHSLTLILLWQGGGLGLLILIIKKRQKALFDPFDNYFMYLYRFKTMLRTSRPLDEVLKSINLGLDNNKKDFKLVNDRVHFLCLQIKKKGVIELSEIDYLILELWDHFELQFNKFSANISALKLASLVIFVLPSFFMCLLLIFEALNVFE